MAINPKKSLGQNWLNSDKALETIVKAGQIKPGDLVLEIGPGTGALTQKLIEAGAIVIAIEKDNRLIPLLEGKFSTEIDRNKLQIIEADILETDITKIIGRQDYKLIANIPYYITGQIFKKFLQDNLQPTLMVVLIQKEVAERITGNLLISSKKPVKESILSLSIKVYGKPKYISTIKKGSFTPAPKVDSAILLIEDISKNFFIDNNINENHFFNLIKKGFSSKRKLLKSNLEINEEILATNKINPLARAEDLNLENWKNISQSIL